MLIVASMRFLASVTSGRPTSQGERRPWPRRFVEQLEPGFGIGSLSLHSFGRVGFELADRGCARGRPVDPLPLRGFGGFHIGLAARTDPAHGPRPGSAIARGTDARGRLD